MTLDEEKIKKLDKLIQDNPDNADAYYKRGVLYAPFNFGKAINDYNEAIRCNPDFAAAYNNRGTLYAQLKNFEKAMNDYNEVIRCNPNLAEAYYNRGVLYVQLNKSNEAINDFNKAIRCNPNLAEAYYNRGVLYVQLNKSNEAINDFNEAIRCNPHYAEAYYHRGILYTHLDNFEKAMNDYNEAIRCNPRYAEAYYNRGILYTHLDNFEKAMNDYNEAIRCKPRYAEAYNNRGGLYIQLDKFEESMNDFNEAIRCKPRYAEAYYNRGGLYVKWNDFEKARNDYNKAIRCNPDLAEAYYNLGTIYDNQGDYNLAFEKISCSFQKTIKNNKENSSPDLLLYRYCNINERVCESLKNNNLWLAFHETFNDPHDGILLYEALNKNKAPNKSKGLTQALNNIGVSSFEGERAATGGLSKLMWAHYADSNQGMCLVFQRTQKVDSNILKQVEYNQNPLFIMKDAEKTLHQGFCVKSKDWSYEKEWRIIAYEEELGQGKLLTYEALGIELKAIIFGLKCAESDQSRIKSLMTEIQPGITFYKIKLEESGQYKLRKELL